MIDFELLKGVGLFRGLTNHQLVKIQPLCEEMRFSANEKILSEGDSADFLYFVLEGLVDIRFDLPPQETSRNMTIFTVERGKAFGWSSLVEPYTYSRSAYCATDTCRVGQVNVTQLRDCFEKDTGIGYIVMTNLARAIAKRQRALQEEVVSRGGWA